MTGDFPVDPPPRRDRDEAGRPRNARPRDDLGRPLPRDATPAVPGSGAPASPREAASVGGTLLLEGHPFHAHEVFEEAWKAARGPERDLWRGLAQVAVGLTHARRGNASGAVSLLRRGAARLRDSGLATPYGVDVGHVASRADDLANRIESEGLDALDESAFLLRLRPE